MPLDSIGTPPLWIGFTLFVLAMLALDLGVFHRKAHVVGVREALVWTAVWIALALLRVLPRLPWGRRLVLETELPGTIVAGWVRAGRQRPRCARRASLSRMASASMWCLKGNASRLENSLK